MYKNNLLVPGIEPPFFGCPDHYLDTVSTALSRFFNEK